MRARPVPFCRQSLRPAPLTSLFSLVLCVPRRKPFRYHREASCNRCWFTSAPKTASASSTWPTFLPSRLTTSTTGISFSLSIPILRRFSFQTRFLSPTRMLRSPPSVVSAQRWLLCCFLGLQRLADENVLPAWPRNRTANQKQVLVRVHLDHFQVLCRHLGIPHVPREMLVLPHARREGTAPDAAWRAMEHGTVGCVPPGIVPALHAARETAALADTADIDQLAGFEILHQHAIADLRLVLRFPDANLLENLHRRNVGLLEVPGHGLVHTLRLDEFHQAELRGVVAVLLFRAPLDYHAGTRLQHRATHQVAVCGEDLRHTQLDSDNPVDCHCPSLSLAAC